MALNIGQIETVGRQTRGNDICVVTGMAVRRRTDCKVLTVYWQVIVAHNLVVLQQGGDVAFVMPIVPQSEIQVKFLEEIFKETDEKRGEILAKFSVDFRPLISRELATRNFTQIPPHIRTSNSTRLIQTSFTAILWELVGPTFV